MRDKIGSRRETEAHLTDECPTSFGGRLWNPTVAGSPKAPHNLDLGYYKASECKDAKSLKRETSVPTFCFPVNPHPQGVVIGTTMHLGCTPHWWNPHISGGLCSLRPKCLTLTSPRFSPRRNLVSSLAPSPYFQKHHFTDGETKALRKKGSRTVTSWDCHSWLL